MRVAALTRGALTREEARRAVETTFFAALFTGFFLAAAAGLPALDRYRFFFDFVDGAGVLVGVEGAVAPRHTPTATSAANPTLGKEIIL
jgi:hypothetical protein